MGWFIALLGIVWIVFGIVGLVATKRMHLALSNLIKNVRRQTLGLLSLIIGVLLLISASSAREAWFVLMLGIITCLKGVTTILTPQRNLKAIIDWWLSAPEIVHKGWAITLLILGVVIFYII